MTCTESRAAAAAAGSGPISRLPAKYTVKTPRIAHHAMTRRVPVRPSRPYAIAIQMGYPCGNWPRNGAGFRVAQMESHEADAVVARVVVLREKEIAHRRRHCRGDPVGGDEGPALRDLDALVDVHARIASAYDLFSSRRSEIHPPTSHNQRGGDRRVPIGSWRSSAKS